MRLSWKMIYVKCCRERDLYFSYVGSINTLHSFYTNRRDMIRSRKEISTYIIVENNSVIITDLKMLC